jgi:hypothetical protein
MKALSTICIVGSIAFGQALPETMTKISVRLESPDDPADSFAAKPKTMYRAGNGYCRTEEVPDPEHGIHGLMILNEPDAWMVNLLSKTARHFVDPGPTFNCHLPLFGGEPAKSAAEMKNPLLELEFGQELEYFKGKRATPSEGPILRERQTTIYAVTIGDSNWSFLRSAHPSDLGRWRDSVGVDTRSSGMALLNTFRLILSCLQSQRA